MFMTRYLKIKLIVSVRNREEWSREKERSSRSSDQRRSVVKREDARQRQNEVQLAARNWLARRGDVFDLGRRLHLGKATAAALLNDITRKLESALPKTHVTLRIGFGL